MTEKKPLRQPSIGLALGSGIARGWAHIGVLRALDRYGLEPDIVCGTSIGALVGGLYLAGELDALELWARSLASTSIFRYMDVALGGGGIIGGKHLTKLIRETVGETRVEDLDRRFAGIAADLASGHEIWLRQGPLQEVLRASFSLPGVFTPVHINNQWLVDGALVNPVPVSVCRALGARLVIAVNLNGDIFGSGDSSSQERELTDQANLMSQILRRGPKQRAGAILMRQLFGHDKNAPGLFNIMLASLNIVQDRLSRSRLAGDPPDVAVAPRLGHIGLLEFDRAEEMIAEGEAAMEAALPYLQDALNVLGRYSNPDPVEN